MAEGLELSPDLVAPVARVGMSAADSVNNSATELVPWNVEFEDTTNTQHDNAANNTRLACVKAGLYLVAVQMQWLGNATGRRVLQVIKNGEHVNFTYQLGSVLPPPGASDMQHPLSGPVRLVAGDYLEVAVFQSSGAALAYGGTLSRFDWVWLRA